MAQTRPRRQNLDYDDRLTEDEALPINGKLPMPKTADEVDARWVRGLRGWVTIRDPYTGERHEVPTKYAPEAPHLAKGMPGAKVEPAPFWMVRRAMEKLPPKAPLPAPPVPAPEDEGPL